MKYIISFIIVLLAFSSCNSVNYMTIDVRQPALISFPPEVTKVLLVDNSYSEKPIQEDEKTPKNSVISEDSCRAILLKSLRQFMDEEKYFIKVDLHPYNTYSGMDGDMKPLSPRKVQSLCLENDADALISLDVFVISAQIETENTAYFNNYNILGSKLGVIIKPYASDGSEYIKQPIVLIDSLFREEAVDWSSLKGNINEINSLITEMATVGADKLTSQFIPSWKSVTRWYYSDNSSDMKQAAKLASQGKWQEAATIWTRLYNEENKLIRKARLASNIALADECLDDIENAKKWINTAYELLPNQSKSELSTQIVLYRNDLILRENNIPKLYEQLGIEDIKEE